MSTPIHHKQYPRLPPLEGNQDHHNHVYLHPFFPKYETSFQHHVFLNPSQQQGGSLDGEQKQSHHQHQETNEQYCFPSTGSSDRNGLPASLSTAKKEEISENSIGEDDPSRNYGSAKWMSSKMRLMKKMMTSDRMVPIKRRRNTGVSQDQEQSTADGVSSNIPSTIRVCSDCNTTKTPLWRSGPRGPKSLCNACGIRQRKARRATMAAAAASGGLIPGDASVKVRKEKKRSADSNEHCTVPFKKRPCKFISSQAGRKKLRFDDFTISLSKNSAFHRVFPQDEKEAAILLMALSCGLIRG